MIFIDAKCQISNNKIQNYCFDCDYKRNKNGERSGLKLTIVKMKTNLDNFKE